MRCDFDYYKHSSPTVRFETILIQLIVATRTRQYVMSLDYQQVYINEKRAPEHKCYIRLPDEKFYIITGALYDTKDARMIWYDLMSELIDST